MSETLYFTGEVNSALSFTGDGQASQLIATGTVAAAGPKGDTGATGATGPAGTTDYTQLTNKPTIPTDNAQLTNGAGYATSSALTSSLATKANTSSLSTVATTGAYSDLTGKPTIPTVPTDNSSFTNGAGYLTSASLSTYATQTYVNTAVTNLVNSAPSALDTLSELSAALGNDANFATTVTNTIATKAPALTPTSVKTSAYTASANEFVPVDTTSGAVTITLPSAPPNGTRFGVKLVTQGGTNTVTVTRGGTDVFNKTGGNTSVTVSLLNQGVQFQYYNGIWYGVAADIGLTALDARYAPISLSTSSVTKAQAIAFAVAL